jgi:hypothetical protein
MRHCPCVFLLEELAAGAVVGSVPSPWLAVHGQMVRALSQLTVRLRIGPKSRAPSNNREIERRLAADRRDACDTFQFCDLPRLSRLSRTRRSLIRQQFPARHLRSASDIRAGDPQYGHTEAAIDQAIASLMACSGVRS